MPFVVRQPHFARAPLGAEGEPGTLRRELAELAELAKQYAQLGHTAVFPAIPPAPAAVLRQRVVAEQRRGGVVDERPSPAHSQRHRCENDAQQEQVMIQQVMMTNKS